jgi:ABC-2 type transport system permease protein
MTTLGTPLRDVGIVAGRELRPLLRSPFSLIFGIIQPLVFLALFGPLLAGSMRDGNGGLGADVWQWFVPAILVMTTLFGTSTVGANLLSEFVTGSHERMLVTPLSRQSLLIGRALKEMVPLAGQALVIILVMLPFGFDLHPAGALLGLALLTLFGVGLGSLSYSLAVAVRRNDWMFWVVHQTLLFPLMILSGMLLPLETGPGWMQAMAKFNPLAHMVTAERLLFAGRISDTAVLWGFVAAAATALVGLWVGIRAMRHSA